MAAHQTSIDMVVHDSKVSKKTKKCIFKVPKVLRRQNSEAYTPDVVSIGPFHHRPRKGSKEGKECEEGKDGKESAEFQLMEQVKETYLKEILSSMKSKNLEELKAKLIEHSDQKDEEAFENRAREFYAEPLHLSPEDFMEMMIIDGCFLIQLFRKCKYEVLRKGDDPAFNMDCMFHFLCHDLLLLENQLPWFVLESLYNLILRNCQFMSHPSPF